MWKNMVKPERSQK